MPKAGYLLLCVLAGPLVAAVGGCTASSRPSAQEPRAATAPIVAEAEEFMAAYAEDLRRGDRAAVAARYDRGGAWQMGRGQKRFAAWEEIARSYRTDWEAPARFEWRDLSYEPLGRDAVAVLGTFLWTLPGATAPVTFSYTGLLVRKDGELRVRIEDESAAPPPR